MRKLWIVLVLGALAASYAAAESGALIIGGVTMVPVRTVAESFGASVNYNARTGQVDIGLEYRKVTLGVDSPRARVDGREVSLGVAATVIEGVTYVPVRFVSETFGAQVDWDDAAHCVTVHRHHAKPLILVAREHHYAPGQAKKRYSDNRRGGGDDHHNGRHHGHR